MPKKSMLNQSAGVFLRIAVYLLPAVVLICFQCARPCFASQMHNDSGAAIGQDMGADSSGDAGSAQIDIRDSMVRGGLLYDVTSGKSSGKKIRTTPIPSPPSPR